MLTFASHGGPDVLMHRLPTSSGVVTHSNQQDTIHGEQRNDTSTAISPSNSTYRPSSSSSATSMTFSPSIHHSNAIENAFGGSLQPGQRKTLNSLTSPVLPEKESSASDLSPCPSSRSELPNDRALVVHRAPPTPLPIPATITSQIDVGCKSSYRPQMAATTNKTLFRQMSSITPVSLNSSNWFATGGRSQKKH
jgi:hypothetical protein